MGSEGQKPEMFQGLFQPPITSLLQRFIGEVFGAPCGLYSAFTHPALTATSAQHFLDVSLGLKSLCA